MSETKTALSPALLNIIEKAPQELQTPVGAFLGSAVHIISFMGEIDLSGLHVGNDGSVDAGTAASFRVAVPVTAAALRFFLEGVKSFLPADPAKESNPELAAAYELIANTARMLAQDVVVYEKQAAHPQMGGDSWQVLDLVASLRGKTRFAAGEMIYFLCRAFEDGRKEDFVPSYGEDVDNSVQVRRGVTELRQQVRICVSTMGAVPNDAVPTWVKKLSDCLTAFYQNRAYTCMRVADKRALIGHHQTIKGYLADPKATTGQFIKCIDAVMLFFESLLVINRRALLIAHDKQQIMGGKDHLFNSIEALLTSAMPAALRELELSYACVHATLGRDTHLDNVLMAYRHMPSAQMPQADLLGAAEALLAAVDRMEPF